MSKKSYHVQPGGTLRGHAGVPGDKSVSHRSAILGAVASGQTRVTGFLEGLDTLATLRAMGALGAKVQGPVNGEVIIDGVGSDGLTAASGPLDLGNSGTGIRLLAGLLAGQPFATTLIGDESLSRRPMERIAKPLRMMGASAQTAPDGTPPLVMGGGPLPLKAIDYAMPVASAQVKSCVLLAGLHAQGTVVVREPAPTRDHTERMLRGFGARVRTDGGVVQMEGGQALTGTSVNVPADLSSAAFFLVGASIADRGELDLPAVGMNPTRSGVIDILLEMGASIEVTNAREEAGEPVADLKVRAAELTGIDIDPALVPLAIDEFPALFVAAACARGTTRLTGAAELRVKESDRLGVMADGLRRLGIELELFEDGIVIEGGQLGGGVVESHGDHRIAMAFAMAGLRANGGIEVRDCANVETSFPGFVALSERLGLRIEERAEPAAPAGPAGK